MRKTQNEKTITIAIIGLIYTSMGTQTNIDEYRFDYLTITEPEISIFNLNTPDKKVVIAIPLEDMYFDGHRFMVCFMEIDMREMLQGVSMGSYDNSSTFCNTYTADGIALSNTVLGGLAVEDNLLEALETANFENGFW